jgi:hypothetical protein
MRAKKEATLPLPKQIYKLEQLAKDRLWFLFYTKPALRVYPERMMLGLTRLTEKAAIANTMATHMEQRNMRSIEELAHHLYLDGEALDVLGWLRFPCAFRHKSRAGDHTREDEYLLALCNIEWDRAKNTYSPIESTRLR